MQIELVKGVHLTIIPTTKYTTTKILVNFATKQTLTNSSVRNVLVNLLVNATANYPNQTVLARKLATMYGAELDGYVTRVGTTHNVRLNLSFVNQHLAPQMRINDALDLMQELIFNPLRDQDELSPQSWQLQRDNIASTLSSWEDDKQYLAAKRLLDLYFAKGSVMKVPSTGTAEMVAKVLNQKIVRSYQKMLAKDQVEIIIEGDINASQVERALRQWPWQARSSFEIDVFYHQPVWSNVQVGSHQIDIQQAKLDLAYSFPIYFMDHDYYPALVMNGLFGGGPYSLLFKNVRERASLAYYASTGYRPFAGYLFVQSEINSQDRQRTQQLIGDQLKSIQDGQINISGLEQVKKNLINGYLVSQDNPNHLVERALISNLTGLHLPVNPVELIQSVDRQQVSDVAQKLKLQAEYFLDRR